MISTTIEDLFVETITLYKKIDSNYKVHVHLQYDKNSELQKILEEKNGAKINFSEIDEDLDYVHDVITKYLTSNFFKSIYQTKIDKPFLFSNPIVQNYDVFIGNFPSKKFGQVAKIIELKQTEYAYGSEGFVSGKEINYELTIKIMSQDPNYVVAESAIIIELIGKCKSNLHPEIIIQTVLNT